MESNRNQRLTDEDDDNIQTTQTHHTTYTFDLRGKTTSSIAAKPKEGKKAPIKKEDIL